MRYLSFFLLCVLINNVTLANSDFHAKTLLTIKLYSEPKDRDRKLTYFVSLPKNENYSYYTGSDLPRWQFVDDRFIQGEFHSVQLINLRIHPNQNKIIK